LMVPLMVPYFSLGQQMDVFFAQGTWDSEIWWFFNGFRESFAESSLIIDGKKHRFQVPTVFPS
jgi:hypothetical protein